MVKSSLRITILVSAVDNTSEGTESAKANVFSVPHEWWSWLFGLDGTSGPSGIAKNAVESIPQQWQSNIDWFRQYDAVFQHRQ